MNAFVDLLLNSEAFFTIICCVVTLFIVGGPMRHQKFRYRLFVFCVGTSLIGAGLDKVIVAESHNRLGSSPALESLPRNALRALILTRSTDDAISGVLTAKAVILVSRIAMSATGIHILVMWAIQCARINFWLSARSRRRARRVVESAQRLQYQIH